MTDDHHESRFERGCTLLELGHIEESIQYLSLSLKLEGYSDECEDALIEAEYRLNPFAHASSRQEDQDDEEEDDYDNEDEDDDAGDKVENEDVDHYIGSVGADDFTPAEIDQLLQGKSLKPAEVGSREPRLTSLQEKAIEYIDRKLFYKAIELYNECLILKGDDPKLYYSRGWAKLGVGLAAEAHADIRIADKMKKRSARRRRRRPKRLMKKF